MSRSVNSLERRVRAHQVLGLYAGAVSILQVMWLSGVSSTPLRLMGTALGVSGIVSALVMFRTPRPWVVFFFLTLTLAGLCLEWNQTMAPDAVFLTLRNVHALVFVGWVLLALVISTGFVSPLKAFVLFVTTFGALAAVEVALSRSKPAGVPAPRPTGPNETAASGGSGQLEWVNAQFVRDPLLEFRRLGNAKAIAFYPSNPATYFHVIEQPEWWGNFDMRTFGLNRIAPCEGSAVELPITADGPAQIHNRCASEPEGLYKVALARNGVELMRGVTYGISFRARSVPPGRLRFDVSNEIKGGDPPIASATVPIEKEFAPFEFAFTPPQDVARGVVSLSTASKQSDVEIAGFRIHAAGDVARLKRTRYCVEFQMNPDGYRDKPHSVERKPNVVRLVFLGDSMTEGWGVHAEDLFTSRLQKKLDGAPPNPEQRYEVFNFGVSGYGTRQERLLYEHVASKYHPDLVVVMVCFNDDMSAMEENDLRQKAEANAAGVPSAILARLGLAGNERKYDYGVCVAELEALRAACARDGANLAVVFFRQNGGYPWNDCVKTIQKGLSGSAVPTFDAGEVLAVPDPTRSLVVHELDLHPSHVAHKLVAEFLYKSLASSRLLESNGSDRVSKN